MCAELDSHVSHTALKISLTAHFTPLHKNELAERNEYIYSAGLVSRFGTNHRYRGVFYAPRLKSAYVPCILRRINGTDYNNCAVGSKRYVTSFSFPFALVLLFSFLSRLKRFLWTFFYTPVFPASDLFHFIVITLINGFRFLETLFFRHRFIRCGEMAWQRMQIRQFFSYFRSRLIGYSLRNVLRDFR